MAGKRAGRLDYAERGPHAGPLAAALRAGDYPKDAKEGVHTNVPQEHAPDVADADVKE